MRNESCDRFTSASYTGAQRLHVMPSSPPLNSKLFSSYKNHVTLKGLVGIAPSETMTFIRGSISDREIVERSGFLKLEFDKGDTVMADRGFTI